MKRLLIIALLVIVTQLHAQVRIGESEAFSTATVFMEQNAKQGDVTLNLAETVKSKHSGQANLFVFSVQPRGFVIVSATNEVLAYSLHSDFPSTDARPDHIAYWIDLYNKATDYRIEHHLPPIKHEANLQEVEPMLTSAWGQGCFHNKYCPETDDGPCNHASAGCIAVAMAQIMYYHKQPITGNGTVTYNCPPYGTLSANFGQTTYLWEEMADTLHESNPATALLISHCGISVKMDYGPQLSVSNITRAHNAFRYYFSYPFATLSYRSDFDDETWTSLVKDNLDRNLPVYYTGTSSLGRHAFVCDGYDSNGLFHFNFGWDGVADGYYTIDAPSGFSVDQAMIHDLLPVSLIPINSDSHGIIYVTPEGCGDGSSWAQATSDLQSAIYKSQMDGLSIWVKEGTYTGTPNEGYAFNIFGNCQIYGGFEGNEPFDYNLSLRDFEAHPSILDGSQAYGVVSTEDTSCSAVIDGFTIQNGAASTGGGLAVRSSLRLKNCKICHNQAQSNGGGIALLPNNSVQIVIEDCEFFENGARNGGAINDGGNATFLRCTIHDNTALENGGGTYHPNNSRLSQFIHCRINNNSALLGGGIFSRSKAAFWSCLVNNNSAETGGGFYIKGETSLYNCTVVKNEGLNAYGGIYNMPVETQNEVENCIIWGNVSPDGNKQIGPLDAHRYCAVQADNSFASFNFDANPENDGESPGFYVRFSDPDIVAGIHGHGGDWHLRSGSLCIDRANSIPQQPETDLDGNPRLRHRKVDLGAYESDAVAHVINKIFCNDNPYYYNGTLLPTPGAYSFLHSNATYDSLVIIQLDWYTLAGEAEICEGEAYDFFGEMLQEAGHYTTIRNCIVYELDLVVNPMPIVNMEAEICEGETYNFFGVPLHEAGHYSTTNNCKSYELDLSVNPMPVVTMEEEICQGETYSFFGQILSESGHYSKNKDCKDFELDLTVIPQPALRCSNDTLIEYGNVVRLTASGADSYLWSTGETTESITVAPRKDKTYSVKGFSDNGCDKTATVTVSVKEENDKVVLFPNPTSDKTTIYTPFIDEVDVFNLFGEHLAHIKANREAVELDLSSFPDGVYIIQVRQLKNLYHEKLMIRH